MTPYGTKTIHLIDTYIADLHFAVAKLASVRQHIEQGEPDCRLCNYYNMQGCTSTVECVDFSLFERSYEIPLCEVTP